MRIKSCPICGDIPYITIEPLAHYEGCHEIEIRCSNSKCPMFLIKQSSNTVYHPMEEAQNIVKKKWNIYCDSVEELIKEKEK